MSVRFHLAPASPHRVCSSLLSLDGTVVDTGIVQQEIQAMTGRNVSPTPDEETARRAGVGAGAS